MNGELNSFNMWICWIIFLPLLPGFANWFPYSLTFWIRSHPFRSADKDELSMCVWHTLYALRIPSRFPRRNREPHTARSTCCWFSFAVYPVCLFLHLCWQFSPFLRSIQHQIERNAMLMWHRYLNLPHFGSLILSDGFHLFE